MAASLIQLVKPSPFRHVSFTQSLAWREQKQLVLSPSPTRIQLLLKHSRVTAFETTALLNFKENSALYLNWPFC